LQRRRARARVCKKTEQKNRNRKRKWSEKEILAVKENKIRNEMI